MLQCVKVILSLCQSIADSDTLFLEEQLKGQQCHKFSVATKTYPGVIRVIASVSQGSERQASLPIGVVGWVMIESSV